MEPKRGKVRVLLTKSAMDAHDRGIRYIAKKLTDGGIEVIFARYALPEEVINTAIQEDVDAIGISLSGGGHLTDTEAIMGLLKEKNLNLPVVVGGSIPYKDIPKILAMGVKDYFGQGADISNIASHFAELASQTIAVPNQ
jgi:methylmalonyl-CoA mutase C-terminal domain/subunit